MNRYRQSLVLLTICLAVAGILGWGTTHDWKMDKYRIADTSKVDPTVDIAQKPQAQNLPLKPKEVTVLKSTLDTSAWRTYQNKEFGFTIKYPNKWRSPAVWDDNEFPNVTLGPLEYSEGCCYGVKVRFLITPVEEFFNFADEAPISDSLVSINGVQARRVVMDSHYGIKNVVTVAAPFKGVTLLLVYGEGDTEAEAAVSTLKILDTPQTLTSDADTSSWKTYRHSSLGFQLKYPEGWKFKSSTTGVTLNSPENQESLRQIETKKVYSEGYSDTLTVLYYDSVAQELENTSNNLGAKTLDELVERNTMIARISKIEFAGEPAWLVTRGGFGAYFTTLMEHQGHLYEISFGYKATPEELTRTERAILNSFSFTK